MLQCSAGESGFKKTRNSKASTLSEASCNTSSYGNGVPSGFCALFFFFLSCSYLLRYMHLFPTRDLSFFVLCRRIPPVLTVAGAEPAGCRGGGHGRAKACNFGLKVPGG